MERRTDFDPNETISSSLVQNVRSTTSTQPLNHLPLGRIAVSQKWKQTELVECLQSMYLLITGTFKLSVHYYSLASTCYQKGFINRTKQCTLQDN